LRKAFSLIELLVAITLFGIMAILSVNYYNSSTIAKNNIKAELQSHFKIITATILQCKELSTMMPIQTDGSLASNVLLNSLECNTTNTYPLDGGRGGFIPKPLSGFSEYNATQDANSFYFSTQTDLNSLNDDVLDELNSVYSNEQYQLSIVDSKRHLNFYLYKN
jgi:prepilin-type N-terminal cleavage/methylation domain-containing protein